MGITYDYDDDYEGTIASKRAAKTIKESYLKEIREYLKPYPVFAGENISIFSRMLWANITKEFKEPDDILLEYLEKTIQQCHKTLLQIPLGEGFKAYRFILKINRRLVTNKDVDNVEEGEYV